MKNVMNSIWGFMVKNKILTSVIAAILAASVAVTGVVITVVAGSKRMTVVETSSKAVAASAVASEVSVPPVSSAPEIVSEVSSVAEAPAPAPTPKPAPQKVAVSEAPVINTSFNKNSNFNPDSNVFFDAMIYSGYNESKHRSDGLMWTYILCSQKRAKGWLSRIGYGGGCSGYETNAQGMPDIARFERGGLVCASYVVYNYFNYLPNVAGIDTSYLTRPVRSYSAQDFYVAAQDWVAKGYSRTIPFTAKRNGNLTVFNAAAEIPIGSIMVFRDFKKPNSTHCSHVAIYAGYMNGSNWVFHVGNDNGPEFCTMERMSCGPDPQWPLAVITTPQPILDAILKVDEPHRNLRLLQYLLNLRYLSRRRFLLSSNRKLMRKHLQIRPQPHPKAVFHPKIQVKRLKLIRKILLSYP